MQRWFSACRMCLKEWRAKTEWERSGFRTARSFGVSCIRKNIGYKLLFSRKFSVDKRRGHGYVKDNY